MVQLSGSRITPLDYAEHAGHGARRWLYGCIALTLILATAAGWRWGRVCGSQIVLLSHQRACAAYTAPPEQVVFDSDPARVTLLSGDANYAIVRGCAFRKPPAFWDAYLAPSGWLPAGNRRAMVFLHECHTPDGSRFIVGLERTAGFDRSAVFIHGYDIDLAVFRPATATHPAAFISDGFSFSVLGGAFYHNIRIYAGQADLSDASHFTIRYQVGSKAGTLDGRVDNQGRLMFTYPAGM